MTTPLHSVGPGDFVLVTGKDIEFRRAFAQAGGLVCDHVEGQSPGQIDPSSLAVYLYAQSDVYIFPVTALTPTTREEALCAATG